MRLARLGRPVKLMIGGITGWLDERHVGAGGGIDDVSLVAVRPAE
jgi:hypothetical protein